MFAEGAGVGFLLGGHDVGDFGEEGHHGDGEAEADYGAQSTQEDDLVDPVVCDEPEECQGDHAEEEAEGGGAARAVFIDVHTD